MKNSMSCVTWQIGERVDTQYYIVHRMYVVSVFVKIGTEKHKKKRKKVSNGILFYLTKSISFCYLCFWLSIFYAVKGHTFILYMYLICYYVSTPHPHINANKDEK